MDASNRFMIVGFVTLCFVLSWEGKLLKVVRWLL
jgi:hypothetical protein